MQRIASAIFGQGLPARLFPNVCPACSQVQKPLQAARTRHCGRCGCSGFCSQACVVSHLNAGKCTGLPTPCHHPEYARKCWIPVGRACVLRSLNGALRGFAAGYVAKALLNVIVTLISKKSFAKALQELRGFDAIRFGAFLSGLVGVTNAVRCALSHVRGVDDRLNAVIAGFAGGACIALDVPSRQRALGLYFLCRALYFVVRVLMRWHWLPKVRRLNMWLFAAANGPIMYAFLYYPRLLDKTYYQWILNMGNLTDGALKWTLRDSRETYAAELLARQQLPLDRRSGVAGPVYYRRPCDVQYHPHQSCVTAHALDWWKCLLRGARVYGPVHVLPILLFKWKAITTRPASVLSRTSSAILLSSAFISTYQYTVKMTMCMLRQLRNRDDWWHPVLAGHLTGLSLFWEQPKRRSELMLYCLPRGIEVCWRALREAGFVKDVKGAGVLMFAIAMALTLSVNRKDLKPAMQGILWVLFGEAIAEAELPSLKVAQRK